MLNASSPQNPQLTIVPDTLERSPHTQPVLFEELAPETQNALLAYVFDDDTAVDLSEEDVVFLHWKMLYTLHDLSEPTTPLAEKMEILRWVFTDPEKDSAPFSFASCVRVASLSPLSPIPYCGVTDAEDIRDWIRHNARTWLNATIDRYPSWVQEVIIENPDWIQRRLARNPQWINEQVKKHTDQGDLFA